MPATTGPTGMTRESGVSRSAGSTWSTRTAGASWTVSNITVLGGWVTVVQVIVIRTCGCTYDDQSRGKSYRKKASFHYFPL